MKPFFTMLLVLVFLLAVLYLLIVQGGISDPLVPAPENAVEHFIASLSTQRYEIAREDLDNDLQEQTSADDLQQLDQSLRDKLGEYNFVPEGEEEKQGDSAQYKARIKTEQQGVIEVPFDLQRDQETGEWQISSLDGLESQAQ